MDDTGSGSQKKPRREKIQRGLLPEKKKRRIERDSICNQAVRVQLPPFPALGKSVFIPLTLAANAPLNDWKVCLLSFAVSDPELTTFTCCIGSVF